MDSLNKFYHKVNASEMQFLYFQTTIIPLTRFVLDMVNDEI